MAWRAHRQSSRRIFRSASIRWRRRVVRVAYGGSASETLTGTPGVYDYKFTPPAVSVLTGGQGYWPRSMDCKNSFPEWQWGVGTGGTGSHYAVPAINTGTIVLCLRW